MNIFDKYTNKYDLSNTRLNYKYYHSYRVMDNMELLAKNMNFSYVDIELAKCIGLLHDIGRFEQYKRFESFDDELFDHGDYGSEIIKKEQILKHFNISENDYEIVYKAIKYHNKLKLPTTLTKRELLFSKLIRDADKLDILYALSNKEIKERVREDNNQINEAVSTSFFHQKQVDKNLSKSENDNLIIVFSFIYDINFYITIYLIKKNSYYQKIYNRLQNKEIFAPYIEYVNKYLKERID